MQPVDYTTLMAVCAELNRDWIPARIEQVYQRDRLTISLALRTLQGTSWLTISWHPEAASSTWTTSLWSASSDHKLEEVPSKSAGILDWPGWRWLSLEAPRIASAPRPRPRGAPVLRLAPVAPPGEYRRRGVGIYGPPPLILARRQRKARTRQPQVRLLLHELVREE